MIMATAIFSTYSPGVRSGWLAADPAALELPPGCHWESAHFAEGDVATWARLVAEN